MVFTLRTALRSDEPTLRQLIARSIRQLGATDYSDEQIEAALTGVFGVDTQLIDDGTYYVVEADQRIIACGGWSRRRTLFGGDSHNQRDDALLDPATEAAKIRAFFVDPNHARQGIGSALMEQCEQAARRCGFRQLELMATLPGAKLYTAHGFNAGIAVQYPLTADLTIEFIPMTKSLTA